MNTQSSDWSWSVHFSYKGSEIRVIRDGKGEPWFVGMDVCAVLGLSSPFYTYSRLDADEKSYVGRTRLGMQPGKDMVVVNEPGLYKLILRSDKLEAQRFQRWITHVVLPQIRKTGGYLESRLAI